jgi:hypothetical protein
MTTSQGTCGCGSATTTGVEATTEIEATTEPCTCGCCGPQPTSAQDEISRLRSQRDAIDRQLAELENA